VGGRGGGKCPSYGWTTGAWCGWSGDHAGWRITAADTVSRSLPRVVLLSVFRRLAARNHRRIASRAAAVSIEILRDIGGGLRRASQSAPADCPRETDDFSRSLRVKAGHNYTTGRPAGLDYRWRYASHQSSSKPQQQRPWRMTNAMPVAVAVCCSIL